MEHYIYVHINAFAVYLRHDFYNVILKSNINAHCLRGSPPLRQQNALCAHLLYFVLLVWKVGSVNNIPDILLKVNSVPIGQQEFAEFGCFPILQ